MILFGATTFYLRSEKSQAQEKIKTADAVHIGQVQIIEPIS